MTFAERDELAMELWKEGENHVLRRDWPGARKARLCRKRAGLCVGALRDQPDAGYPRNAGVPDRPCGLVFLGQLDPEGGRSV